MFVFLDKSKIVLFCKQSNFLAKKLKIISKKMKKRLSNHSQAPEKQTS